ncbi:MAG: mechanosensitive ion channel family protein [Candidatus Neomarinimicrobiota bacterium]
MIDISFPLDEWFLPIFVIVAVTLFGIIFKFLIHSRLSKIAKRSKWEGDDVIILSVESQIVFWFFLFGLSLALKDAPIPDKYIRYSSDLLHTLLIASITHAAAKLVVGLFNLWSKKHGGGFPSTTIFTNIVWITVYVIGLLIILDNLDISIAPMLTALGVGGLAVSLALKDTLSDVFAGLHILLSKKVEPGDFVSLDSGEMGYIQNISWRNTKMLERSNNLIHIPNTKLSTAIIKNYDSGDPSFSVKIPVGVSYDSDLDHVGQVIIEITNEMYTSMEEINKDAEPSFKFRGFGESSIDLAVYFRGNKYGDQNPIIHEFIKRLHKRFAKEGIEIPYPVRTIFQNQK